MNLHLLGKRAKITAIRVLLILPLLLPSAVTVFGDDDARLSGVVKPKVSVIKPYKAAKAQVIEEF